MDRESRRDAAPPKSELHWLLHSSSHQLPTFFSFFFSFLADLLDRRSCFQTAGKKTLCLTSTLVLQRSTTAEGEQPKNWVICWVVFFSFFSHLLMKPCAHSVPAIKPSAGTWRGGEWEGKRTVHAQLEPHRSCRRHWPIAAPGAVTGCSTHSC